MSWFSGNTVEYRFELFSVSHLIILLLLFIVSFFIFKFRKKMIHKNSRTQEVGIAISLLLFEFIYHIWLLQTGVWNPKNSIPLELCSISLFLTVFLLFLGKKWMYDLLLFTALLGASQAIVTPILYYDFPHFRFIHFFYTHLMMIWVPLYFTWVKGYRPTLRSVTKVFIFLNVLLPVVMLINKLVDGNYMFLSHKPTTPSLLNYLGPYPWYILALEGLLLCLSLIVWALFRQKRQKKG